MKRMKLSIKLLSLGAILIIAYFVFIAICYLNSKVMLDHIESTVGTISGIFIKGGKVYHDIDSAERYSLLYGPALYILNGVFMFLLGPSILSCKIGGVISGILSLLFFFLTLRPRLGKSISLIFVGYIALVYLMYSHYAFWDRADPYIYFLISLVLFVATYRSRLAATITLGMSAGIILNLKLHSILYFVPLYYMFYSKYKGRYVLVAFMIAVVVAVAPFIAYRNISMVNYISLLFIVAKLDITLTYLVSLLHFLIYYLVVPILFFYLFICNFSLKELWRGRVTYIAMLILSTMLIGIFALRCGTHHLIPFLFLYIYPFNITLRKGHSSSIMRGEKRIIQLLFAILFCFVIAKMLFTALKNQGAILKVLSQKSTHDEIVQDINRLLIRYPDDSMEMGYGGGLANYAITFFRPIIVYAKGHCFIDAPAIMETQMGGLQTPQAALTSLKQCEPKIFLIPKDGKPFDIVNIYNSKQLFDGEFKKVFFENYRLKEKTRYFDVYMCN